MWSAAADEHHALHDVVLTMDLSNQQSGTTAASLYWLLNLVSDPHVARHSLYMLTHREINRSVVSRDWNRLDSLVHALF